ncbi:MAG: hypothetical protein QXI84_11455 [Thermofilaceae archaeon]
MIVGRALSARVRDEREAALALLEFVGKRGYFCTVAKLTAWTTVILGTLVLATLILARWISEPFVTLAVFTMAFAVAYSRLLYRELDKLKDEIDCLSELKKAYEKIF